jgi:hypothetical protein
MGNQRTEKSEELRLIYYLRIYGDISLSWSRITIGPMTLYVGLYQETLVGKVDRHPPLLGQP